jgi:hypothetical protein
VATATGYARAPVSSAAGAVPAHELDEHLELLGTPLVAA